MTTTESQKVEICNYLDKRVITFLERYYTTEVHAGLQKKLHDTQEYFKKYGGKEWIKKYESSQPYKDLQKIKTSSIFLDELELLKEHAFDDMVSRKEEFERTHIWTDEYPFEDYEYRPYYNSYDILTQLYIDNVVNVNVDLK